MYLWAQSHINFSLTMYDVSFHHFMRTSVCGVPSLKTASDVKTNFLEPVLLSIISNVD